MKNDPNFKPPTEYLMQKRQNGGRPTDKVYIPVKEFPEINFFGLLVGPRGNSLKGMERDSGAKISIRGKGSVKEGKGRPGGGFEDDENDELHCLITADTEEKVQKCVKLINNVIATVRRSLLFFSQRRLITLSCNRPHPYRKDRTITSEVSFENSPRSTERFETTRIKFVRIAVESVIESTTAPSRRTGLLVSSVEFVVVLVTWRGPFFVLSVILQIADVPSPRSQRLYAKDWSTRIRCASRPARIRSRRSDGSSSNSAIRFRVRRAHVGARRDVYDCSDRWRRSLDAARWTGSLEWRSKWWSAARRQRREDSSLENRFELVSLFASFSRSSR